MQILNWYKIDWQKYATLALIEIIDEIKDIYFAD